MKCSLTLAVVGFFLLNVNVHSQNIQKYNETYRSTATTITPADDTREYYSNYQNTLQAEYDGTYQFIITGTDKISITSELKDLIKENRSKTDEVQITINSSVQVRILSERFIKSKKFIPIKEMFVFQ